MPTSKEHKQQITDQDFIRRFAITGKHSPEMMRAWTLILPQLRDYVSFADGHDCDHEPECLATRHRGAFQMMINVIEPIADELLKLAEFEERQITPTSGHRYADVVAREQEDSIVAQLFQGAKHDA